MVYDLDRPSMPRLGRITMTIGQPDETTSSGQFIADNSPFSSHRILEQIVLDVAWLNGEAMETAKDLTS